MKRDSQTIKICKLLGIGRFRNRSLKQSGLTSVQFSSVAQSCPTLFNPKDCSKPGLPVHNLLPDLLKLMSTEVSDAINHLILCCPFLLLPSIFLTSGSFLMSHYFASGDQSIRASASASVLLMNTQD